MSKAKKRLIVRLSIVSAIVGLGVFALIQAQIRDSRAGQENKANPNQNAPANGSSSNSNRNPDTRAVVIKPVVYKNADGGNQSEVSSRPTSAANERLAEMRGGTLTATQSSLPAEPRFPPTDQLAQVDSSGQFKSSGEFRATNTPLPSPTQLRSVVSDAEANRGQESKNGTSFQLGDLPAVKSGGPNYSEADNRLRTSNVPTGTSRQNLGNPANIGDNREVVRELNATQTRLPVPSSRQLESRVPATIDAGAYEEPFEYAASQPLDPLSTGTPGATHLEGARTPSVTVEKRAPSEIQVGKPATFEIHVQNTGRVDANNVMVLDHVPRGTRFVDASPAPQQAGNGELLWQLGTFKPGDEKTISIQLIPTQEGEIGSVASVAFEAEASVKTLCTRPRLAIEIASEPRVLIGDSIKYVVKVSNPGTGDATGVILEEDVPDGFSHPAGNELEFEIGTLRPGESREVTLSLKAEQAGLWENLLLVRGDGNLVEEDAVAVEITAPELKLATSGPKKRYLERPATYNIQVANPGTAPANEIELVAFLHKGMKFVETDSHGQYDPTNHAVYWSLERLPAKEQGDVQLTVVPVETGGQLLRVEGRAELGLAESHDHDLEVEGLAALFFDVIDLSDPIEVGSDTIYQVRVVNQGSKTATNVILTAAAPGGMQPIGGDGPTQHHIQGQLIEFEPLTRLAPKSEAVFKMQVRGLQDGDQRIKVQLTSDDFQKPITKEESTRVYVDR